MHDCTEQDMAAVFSGDLLQWSALMVITGECLAYKVLRFDAPLCRDLLIALPPQFTTYQHSMYNLQTETFCNVM